MTIDLTDTEERAFTRAMRPYLRAARPVSPTPEPALGDEQARRTAYLCKVAQFARTHGYALPNPRRPSPELERAYLAALTRTQHGPSVTPTAAS